MAGAEGFEPPKAVLETAGLPLAYAPNKFLADQRNTGPPTTKIPLFFKSGSCLKARTGPDGPTIDQKLDSAATSGSVVRASSSEAIGPRGPRAQADEEPLSRQPPMSDNERAKQRK